MNVSILKLSLLTYLKHFGLYDYMAFFWLVITFFMLIVLAILVAKRSSVLSLLLIIISLITLIVSPFLIKYKVSEIMRPSKSEITLIKKLTFSSSLIVEGTITNLSSKDFSLCLVHTSIFKQDSSSGVRAYINKLKPIANQSIIVKETILKNDQLEFKAVFDDFNSNSEVSATLSAECY